MLPCRGRREPHQYRPVLQAVLEPVFHQAGIEVDVTPLAYQTCGKVPVIITLNGKEPRLLWYHKGMSAEALSEELFWLLFDVPMVIERVPA